MLNEKTIELLLLDAKDVWVKNWNEIEKMFNRCCFSISYDTIIKKLNLFSSKEEVYSIEEIKKSFNLFKDAEYLFERMIDILCEENVLLKEANGYKLHKSIVDIENPHELLVMAARYFPEEAASFQWLSRAAGGIYDFVRGKAYGEEVMFPFNDFSLVEDVYYSSKIYSFWSRLAGKSVKRILESQYDRKITILEVGAGTGNGTYNVFENIENVDNKIEKYVFTDISKSLLKKVSKSERFSKYDFIEYKVFDLREEIINQNFEENSFDIVLAVNVLHATPDLNKSCQQLYKLVKSNGYVVLGEISPPEGKLYRYMELTFGLLSSYYSFSDKNIRKICPIVRPDEWIKILKATGFSQVIAIPGKRITDCDRGGVIIAKK